MSSGSVRAGRAHVEVGVRSKIKKGLQSIKAKLKGFAVGVAKITAVGAAGALALGAGILAAARKFAAFGDVLDKTSKRTGIAVEALSEYKFAAEQGGSSIETFEKGVKRMQQTLLDAERGMSTATDAFDELGMSADDLQGMSPDKQFETIAKKLNEVEDASRKAAIAQMIFGRAGTQLLPMIDNLEEAKKRAQELGITMSTEDANAAAELTDRFNELGSVIRSAVLQIGAVFAPMISSMVKGAAEGFAQIGQFFRDNFGGILDALKSGDLELAGQIAFTQLKLTVTDILIGLGDAFGTSLDGMLAGIAQLRTEFLKIGLQIGAAANQGAVMWKAAWKNMSEGNLQGFLTDLAVGTGVNAAKTQLALKQIENDTAKFENKLRQTFDRDALAAELEALTALAKQKSAEAFQERMDQINTPIDLENQLSKVKGKALGTFSAEAAAQLGIADSPQKQIAKNTKKANELLKTIAENTSENRTPVFTA